MVQSILQGISDKVTKAREKQTRFYEKNPGVLLTPRVLKRLEELRRKVAFSASRVDIHSVGLRHVHGTIGRHLPRLVHKGRPNQRELKEEFEVRIYAFEAWIDEEGEWVFQCSCGEPRATESICYEGVAVLLSVQELLRRPDVAQLLRRPDVAEAMDGASLEQLQRTFKVDNVIWHYSHGHKDAWIKQLEHDVIVPTFSYKSKQDLLDTDVCELLDPLGHLPLCPPPGRGRAGRRKVPRATGMLSLQSVALKKARIRGIRERGGGSHRRRGRRDPVGELEERMPTPAILREEGNHEETDVPLKDKNLLSILGMECFSIPKISQDMSLEVKGEVVKGSTGTGLGSGARGMNCTLCGKEHSNSKCPCPDTGYILKHHVPGWKPSESAPLGALGGEQSRQKKRRRKKRGRAGVKTGHRTDLSGGGRHAGAYSTSIIDTPYEPSFNPTPPPSHLSSSRVRYVQRKDDVVVYATPCSPPWREGEVEELEEGGCALCGNIGREHMHRSMVVYCNHCEAAASLDCVAQFLDGARKWLCFSCGNGGGWSSVN